MTADTTLIQNIAASYTCYNITGNSLTFDCAGYNITGNGSGYAFNISYKNNIVIKNCIISNFSRAISAENAINLAFINITIYNVTDYGIFVNASANTNISSVSISESRPAAIAIAGANLTGIYLLNVSNGNFSDITIQKLFAGNTSVTSQPGGSVVGISYQVSQNSNFTNIYIRNLIPGRGITTQTAAAFGHSGNATGIFGSNFNSTIFQNISIHNLLGSQGSRGRNSGTGGDGSESSNVIGFYATNGVNSTISNLTISNLSSGVGGNGGTGSSAAGGAGGNAGFVFGIYFQNSFNNSIKSTTILNLTGEFGGNAGAGATIGGNGGIGGQVFSIGIRQLSYNISINGIDIRFVQGGTGGSFGSGTPDGSGGFGGNSSFLYISNSNATTFENAYANSSIGGDMGTSAGAVLVHGGIGSGIYFHLANYTNINNASLYNISSGTTDVFGMLRTSGLFFAASSFNKITNSTIKIIDHHLDAFDPLTDYSIYSEGGSINNNLLNSSFNRSNIGFFDAAGINNLTISWFATVNVTNGSGQVGSANVRIYNQTSSAIPMLFATTDSNGHVNAEIAEMTIFGYISSASSCKAHVNNTCFTNHTISVNNSVYAFGTSIAVLNYSKTIPIFLCSSLQSSTTLQNNVSFNDVCFTLNASNIVLDCANNAIIGNRSGFSIGVYANSKSNVTIKNCYISNFSSGIMANYTSRSVFLNNTIIDTAIVKNQGATAFGIYFNNSDYNNLTSNFVTNLNATAISSLGYPNCNTSTVNSFRFENSSHNFATNINGSLSKARGYSSSEGSCALSSTGIGVHVIYSINNSISYGKFSGNNYLGAYLISTNSTIISHSEFMGNPTAGFSAEDSINTIINNGTFMNNNFVGVQLTDLANFNISILNSNFTFDKASITSPNTTLDNNLFSFGDPAIKLDSGSNGFWISRNTIQHSVITSTNFGSLYIKAGNYGHIIDNLIYNTTNTSNIEVGAVYSEGDFNNYTGNNITNSSVYGFYFRGATNNLIASGVISQTAKNDSHFPILSSNNVFLNMSFNRSKITAAGGSNLTIRWYLTLNITNSSGGPIPAASVNITNNSFGPMYAISTNADSTGYLRNQIITEYIVNGSHGYDAMCLNQNTVNCYNPHTFLIQNRSFNDNQTSFNITSSSTLQIILYPDSTFPSNITLVSPTPLNGSGQTVNWFIVNFTFNETYPQTCWVSLTNTSNHNLTMAMDGNSCYLNVTGQSDGSWNYTVFVNDSVGNTASNGTFFIAFDSNVPTNIQTVFPTLNNATYTSQNWVIVNTTFTELNPNNCILQWGNGTFQNLSMARSGNSCYLNVTGQTQGVHNYTIIVNDTAGNFAQNGTFYITIDLTAPSTIEIVSPTLSNASYTIHNWVYFNATFTETNPNNCILQYSNGSLANYSMTRSNNNCYLNLTGQPNGAHNYTIIVNDSAGNLAQNGTFFITLDSTPPSAIQTVFPTLNNATYTSQNWVFINSTFTELNPNNCILQWGNGTFQNLSMQRSANTCFLNITTQPEGIHNYTIIVNDSAGNFAQNGTFYITIDLTAPSTIETVSPTLSNSSVTIQNWVFINASFTETNPNNCILQYSNGSLANYSMARSGNNCYANLTNQPQGAHNYTIIVNDTSGNLAQNGTFFITIDQTAPSQITLVPPSPSNNSRIYNGSATINATFTEANPNNCLLQYSNGSLANYSMARSGNSCYFDLTNQPNGNWNYTIIVNDSVGNLAQNGTFFISFWINTSLNYLQSNQSYDNNGKVNITAIFSRNDRLNLTIDTTLANFILGNGTNITINANNISLNFTDQPTNTTYFASGLFERTIDAGYPNAHWKINWNANEFSNASLTVQAAVSGDNSTFTAFENLTNPLGTILNLTPARYLKYRLVFNSNGSSSAFLNEINATALFGINGSASFVLTNLQTGATATKSCTAINGNCSVPFLFPSDLPSGNYSVNISASNSAEGYESAFLIYNSTFEESLSNASVFSPSKTVTNFIAGSTWYLHNVTVTANSNGSIFNVSINYTSKPASWEIATLSTSCSGKLFPSQTCNSTFNVTVGSDATPNTYVITWNASWLTNNNTNFGNSTPSNVVIQSSPAISANISEINVSSNLSQSNVTIVRISNIGNVQLQNVTASFIPTNANSSWFSFNPQIRTTLSAGNNYDLTINITVQSPFTAGTYTGKINITADDATNGVNSTSTYINVTIILAPQILAAPFAVTANQSLSSPQTFNATISAPGNSPLTNVSVSIINSTIPLTWIAINSSSSNWNTSTNTWTVISEGSGAVLQIIVSILDFISGIFSALIKITSNEGVATYVNVTVNVSPSLAAQNVINLTTTHGQTNQTSFLINSTGNSKLVNLTISLIEGSLPTSWVSFSPSFVSNITEGLNYSISMNVSVPFGQPPGNYSGQINISGYNSNKTIGITIEVPTNRSWYYLPYGNQFTQFGISEAGPLGTVTINNTGNVNLTFDLAYADYDGRASCLSPTNFCGAGIGSPANPSLINATKNSTTSFTIRKTISGNGNNTDGYALQITIANTSAIPSTNSTIFFFNITNAYPKFLENIIYQGTINTSIIEIGQPARFNVIATDDQIFGLDPSTAIYNISRPSGQNESFFAVNQTLDKDVVCGGNCQDAQNYTLQYNGTNVTGVFNITFQVKDYLSQQNMTSLQFQVVATTNLTISGNNSQVFNVSSSQNSPLLLNVSIRNTGQVNAYSINFSGMITRLSNSTNTLANWSFNPIPAIAFLNSSTQNLTTFNISIAQKSYGTYYFTPNATYRQPNGTIEVIWGPNLTIEVPENANFSLTPSNQSLAIHHSLLQSEWFTINSNGNANLTNYNISYSTLFSNFTVNFSQTTGSLNVGESANITFNVSVSTGAVSGNRNFTINVTTSSYSRTFNVNLTVPFNNTWSISSNTLAIEGIASDNQVNSQIIINNSGTSDANLNFTFNLTGNMTQFSNLLNSSNYLNYSQGFAIPINYSAPDVNAYYIGVLNITESNSSISRLVNITFRAVTVQLVVQSFFAPAQTIAGDAINTSLLLIFGGQNSTVNSTWSLYLGTNACALTSNSTVGNLTSLGCNAPTISDGRFYNFTISVNYSTGNTYLTKNTTNNSAIFYRDVSAPTVLNEITNDTSQYSNITIILNASDNVQVANTTLLLTYPNGTSSNFSLPFDSTLQYFKAPFNFTGLGLYNITFVVNDTSGNNNASVNGSFEIYSTRFFNGSILNLEGNPINTTFIVANSTEGNLEAFATNASGYYNVTLRSKWYFLSAKFLNFNFTISKVDFTTINQSFISIDNFSGSDIISQVSGAKSGFAVIIDAPNNATISVDYSSLLSSITDESALRIYRCSNYTYASRSCVTSWSALSEFTTNTVLNIITSNATSFANSTNAYALVQVPASSTPAPTPAPSGGGSSGGGGGGLAPAATPTPTATPKADNVSAQIDELKKLLEKNESKQIGVEPGVQSITIELLPGEDSQTPFHLKNNLNISSNISITIAGTAKQFVTPSVSSIKLIRLHETDILLFASIPEGTRPSTYYGELQLSNEVGKVSIPLVVRVLEKRENRAIDLRLQPLVESLDPGETLRVEVNLYNLADPKDYKGAFTLELVDPVTDTIIVQNPPEEITFQTTLNSIKPLKIPRDTRTGRFVVRGIYEYNLGSGKREISAVAYVRIQTSIWSSKLFGTLSLWQLFPILIVLAASAITYYRQYSYQKSKRRYVSKTDFTKLPEPGSRSGYLGLIAETKVRAFVPIDKLQTHTLIAGATGSGKTVAAQVIVEEALQKNTSVLVFDPTAQWTGFLRSQKNRDMLATYKRFGMNADEAKAFKGNIFVVRDPNMPLDIKKYMKPGEITIFVMNKLSLSDHETFISNTVKQVFATGLPESPELKMLLVYDEVHRLLPKFGGKGEGFVQIERGAREFRKWGVGMVLISQVLSDFIGEIKANIGTELQLRTKYEGDLERLKLKYGEDAARSIVKESIGSGMVQNSEYNNGQPYFVSFRPLLHNVVRLSDAELSSYETYNEKLEKLDFEMEQLRQSGSDVLDLELEINLARDKIKKGSFNIVEIYLESLQSKIEGMKKAVQKKAMETDLEEIGMGSGKLKDGKEDK
ncbi:DUF87 domain-containing protein [Candidatus Micrarchaeota archaeon]|nr:DUF87 domain-containing protein [Candidatus Micrarchaeota archaeon]